jgi:two-component system nitrogen regulation sensor histidine kinase GlnL
MTTFFEFTVNSALQLQSWNAAMDELPNRGEAPLWGRCYYELLPRIFREDRDAIPEAIASGIPLRLSSHRFPCFAGVVTADVVIEPESLPGGSGARVAITVHTCCEAVGALQECRHLVNLGKTASMLSHGVRNPLNAIKGAVVYLKSRYGDDANLLEFTGIMEEEITRLDQFISGFLSASATSFGRDHGDINALLKKLEQFVALQARAAGIALRFDLGGSMPILAINLFQVEHAILNVLNNAIHAMPEGGEIRVASYCEKGTGGGSVVVEVVDNGPGMDERCRGDFHQPRLISSGAEGKGFGLFIVREIMRQHGGSLEIRSGRERGTAVRLVFPVAAGQS